jgi:hypothetical protein
LKPYGGELPVACDEQSRQPIHERAVPNQHQRPSLSTQQLCDGTDVIPGTQSGEDHNATFWFEVISQDGRCLSGAAFATVADLKDLDVSAAY